MIICKYFIDYLIIISKKIGNKLVSFFNDYVFVFDCQLSCIFDVV
jgi:hypothetical protein